MANRDNKVAESVAGKYYVDQDCTACGLCEGSAPGNFKMTDEGTFAYAYKQPQGDAEESACKAATEDFPSEAIGTYG